MKNKRILIMLVTVLVVLSIPAIAMQFTNEVNWSIFDFVAAAVLLFGTCLLCEYVLRKVNNPKNRVVLLAMIILVLVLVWLELAVGIFGTPFSGS